MNDLLLEIETKSVKAATKIVTGFYPNIFLFKSFVVLRNKEYVLLRQEDTYYFYIAINPDNIIIRKRYIYINGYCKEFNQYSLLFNHFYNNYKSELCINSNYVFALESMSLIGGDNALCVMMRIFDKNKNITFTDFVKVNNLIQRLISDIELHFFSGRTEIGCEYQFKSHVKSLFNILEEK